MTAIRFVQLACEGQCCGARYPERPATDTTAGDLRAAAADVGWEVLRHTTGRDMCPACRVKEIELAAGLTREAEPR